MEDRRDLESLRRHYEVESELAARLRASTREERSKLFATLYGELFERVPDHPRVVRRETEAESRASVAAQMRLVRPFLKPETVFVEFAPGDCRLSFEVARHVAKVFAADISDQRGKSDALPPNVELIVYDGYNIDLPAGCADVAFSYQFMEHLHPDDVGLHLEQAAKVLRKGGMYVVSTPHLYSGPHDISRHFSDYPTGFHLKEWTYRDMKKEALKAGFSGWGVFRSGKVWWNPLVTGGTVLAEFFCSLLPRKMQRKVTARPFSAVNVVLLK